MRDCTCGHTGICVVCRHAWRVEYLPLGFNPLTLTPCHRGAPLGYDHERDTQLGGCSRCRSQTTWRWHCSSCPFVSAWVEDNVAAAEIRAEYDRHRDADV